MLGEPEGPVVGDDGLGPVVGGLVVVGSDVVGVGVALCVAGIVVLGVLVRGVRDGTAAVTGTSPSSTVRGDAPGVPDSTWGAAV